MSKQQVQTNDLQKDLYGSFRLGDMEFALPVTIVQEVINEPTSYTRMPLAPDYLLGLYNLRGMVIPIVDLNDIFSKGTQKKEERKVAIIEFNDHCIGIVFDQTGSIFNANEEDHSLFNSRNTDSIKESIIKGVFKLDDGARMIQIIDPIEVLHLNQVPMSNKTTSGKNIFRRRKGQKLQCISFEVGQSVCAIDINSIQEVIEIEKIKNTALSGDLCLGAIDVRGNTVPVIDFNKILGYSNKNDAKPTEELITIIILQFNDEFFGLKVRSIKSIVSYFKEDLITFPVLGDERKLMFSGCITSNENTILLDHKHILTNDEISNVTKGHSKLYKEHISKDSTIEETIKKKEKKTYLTFSINNKYALEINEVSEVIDYPDELIVPPNLPEIFAGMINLRGELITVINSKKMYNLPETQEEKLESEKILIFEIESVRYGLIVDSVNSIITFCGSNELKLPDMVFKNNKTKISNDIKEALQITTQQGVAETMLVLSLSSICKRLDSHSAA